jgi:hypothetical protein
MARELDQSGLALVPLSCGIRSTQSRQEARTGPLLLERFSGRVLAAIRSRSVPQASGPPAPFARGLPGWNRVAAGSCDTGRRNHPRRAVLFIIAHSGARSRLRDQFERQVSASSVPRLCSIWPPPGKTVSFWTRSHRIPGARASWWDRDAQYPFLRREWLRSSSKCSIST